MGALCESSLAFQVRSALWQLPVFTVGQDYREARSGQMVPVGTEPPWEPLWGPSLLLPAHRASLAGHGENSVPSLMPHP